VRLENSSADKLVFWVAIAGVCSGVALAFLIAFIVVTNRLRVPWYDATYFALLSCAGVYSLVRFLNHKR
jgi:hypothetical protein